MLSLSREGDQRGVDSLGAFSYDYDDGFPGLNGEDKHQLGSSKT